MEEECTAYTVEECMEDMVEECAEDTAAEWECGGGRQTPTPSIETDWMISKGLPHSKLFGFFFILSTISLCATNKYVYLMQSLCFIHFLYLFIYMWRGEQTHTQKISS